MTCLVLGFVTAFLPYWSSGRAVGGVGLAAQQISLDFEWRGSLGDATVRSAGPRGGNEWTFGAIAVMLSSAWFPPWCWFSRPFRAFPLSVVCQWWWMQS